MAKNRETTHVQNPAMLAVGLRPDVLVWRQQSGLFYTREGNPVRVGITGQADLGMIVAVKITPEMVGRTIGVAVQAECKTKGGQQSEPQTDWQRVVESRAGVYRLIQSAEDMTRLVAEVQDGSAWA